jgi:hypothetical protein
MSHFNQLPEFEKEFFKLSKKYQSLPEDFKKFERLIETNPAGSGKNFTIIHCSPKYKIVKARLACKNLRDRSMRVIYAYHNNIATFVYMELYFKGNKENEDRERIIKYLKNNE